MRWFGRQRPRRDEIERRWPVLALGGRGGEQAAVLRALEELRALQDVNRPELDFLAARPLLEALVERGAPAVRCAALEAWATVLDGRARREHMDLLADWSSQPDVDPELLSAAIRAALTFDDGGALAAELSRNARVNQARG
jgi:hypothetical protein